MRWPDGTGGDGDHTLEVSGGVLVYDVRGPLPAADGTRPLLMIGHPMGAGGFAESRPTSQTGRSSPTTRAAATGVSW